MHMALSHPSFPKAYFVNFVCAKGTGAEWKMLWLDLRGLANQCQDVPWLMGEDFNCIASIDEYYGHSHPDLGAMQDF